MSKINVLFNTNKYFIDNFLDELEDKVPHIVYSSSDLLVYESNDLEVMINSLGTVTINPIFEQPNLRDTLLSIVNEYIYLTQVSSRFEKPNNFKIISPKNFTTELVDQLRSLNYVTIINDTNDSHTVTVH